MGRDPSNEDENPSNSMDMDYSHYSDAELKCFFDIQNTCQLIQTHNFHSIALQFPDPLLPIAYSIIRLLELEMKLYPVEFFLLADTAYGSCCVDQVAAQHINQVDLILHYGTSCLSPVHLYPVHYVFGKIPFNIQPFVDALSSLLSSPASPPQHILIFADVRCQYALNDIKTCLFSQLGPKFDPSTFLFSLLCIPPLFPSPTELETKTPSPILSCPQVASTKRYFLLDGNPIDASHWKDVPHICVYLGAEGPTLNNLILTYNQSEFYSFHPCTHRFRKESIHVNRTLMKRYYLMEKAKDAQVVGLLCGTLAVQDYLTMLNSLKSLAKAAGIKSYTFVMGKLNVAKLANFMEIDLFILVSCPENTLIDSSEFYKPVITPFEFFLACGHITRATWDGRCITDYHYVLNQIQSINSFTSSQSTPPSSPEMSLISGKIRPNHAFQTTQSDPINPASLSKDIHQLQLEPKNPLPLVSHSAPLLQGYLANRTFSGLEQKLGQNHVSKAVEGTSGIAKGYHYEGSY
eukprot:Sdes_comp14819_c0_seq1m3576